MLDAGARSPACWPIPTGELSSLRSCSARRASRRPSARPVSTLKAAGRALSRLVESGLVERDKAGALYLLGEAFSLAARSAAAVPERTERRRHRPREREGPACVRARRTPDEHSDGAEQADRRARHARSGVRARAPLQRADGQPDAREVARRHRGATSLLSLMKDFLTATRGSTGGLGERSLRDAR